MIQVRTADGVTLRMDRVAASFAMAGFDVFVADFRGHGRSVPPRAGPDDWSFDDLVELDLPAIVAAAATAARCPPDELILLGHSLGGLVSTAALGIGRIPTPRLVVLPATAVWLTGRTGPLARRAVMAAYRGVTALFGRAPIRALRVGTADEAATYVDQLTGWAHAGHWTSLRGVDYRAALATIHTPVLPFVGAGDWMCTPRDAAAFAEVIPTASPVRVVSRDHGDAIDPDHFELFTHPGMRPLWLDLVDRCLA